MHIDYADALTRAMALGKEQHPRAPPEHHGAFARSVARLVVGAKNLQGGETGGPSMRERLVFKEGFNGTAFPFDSAVLLAEEACYGELTLAHAELLQEGCFDDDPQDLRAAISLLHTAQARNGQCVTTEAELLRKAKIASNVKASADVGEHEHRLA